MAFADCDPGMSRGFGPTNGVGTTDGILVPFGTNSTLRTYAVRIYQTGGGGGGIGRVWDKNAGSGFTDFLFAGFDNGLGFNVLSYDRWHTGTNGIWRWPAPAFSIWNTFSMSYNSGSPSNNPAAYINGVFTATASVIQPSGTPLNVSDNYTLGNRSNDNGRYLDGRLGEFAIWDRILSADEHKAYGAGYSPEFPPGLVFYRSLVRDVDGFRIKVNGTSTVTGTLVQPHPTVIYPQIMRPLVPVALPPAGGPFGPLVNRGGKLQSLTGGVLA